MSPLILNNEKTTGPVAKYWAIRTCHSLKSGAIFSSWEDFSFYASEDENGGGGAIFQSFDNVFDAIAYAFPNTKHYQNEAPIVETATMGKAPTTINKNDVLCGRGGFVNHNPGNKVYRGIVNSRKQAYVDEIDFGKKGTIAWEVVNEIKHMNPPGRFLQRNQEGDWEDIGEARAIAKTKQALREIIDSTHFTDTDLAYGDVNPPTPRNNHIMPSSGTIIKQEAPVIVCPPAKKIRLDLEESLVGLSRCVPLRQPVPKRFPGDIEAIKDVDAPRFCQIANFLDKPKENCSMCGEIKHIPAQNKGVCNGCDVRVWLHLDTDSQIKWCKGCKNFRLWAAFGEKGHTTKCLPCRQSQAKRYLRKKSMESMEA